VTEESVRMTDCFVCERVANCSRHAVRRRQRSCIQNNRTSSPTTRVWHPFHLADKWQLLLYSALTEHYKIANRHILQATVIHVS